MNAASKPFDLTIVGGGAGGVLVAIHALRIAKPGQRIALIETSAMLGEGAAYSPRQKELVLNVPTRGMSAFADEPADFLDYACAHEGGDRNALALQFAQRRRYADYLRTRLREARARSAAKLLEVHAHATALDAARTDAMRIVLASGHELQSRNIVLATGNHANALPGVTGIARAQWIHAWDYSAIAQIPTDAEVCIVGSGLSMADSVQSLLARSHRGNIHVLSRHGLLPLAHAEQAAVFQFDVQRLLAMDLRRRVREIRRLARDAQAAGLPWQSVFERLRPHVQALWKSLSQPDQRRFLRHVARYWDIHRHRIAPHVRLQLQAMLDDEQLQVHRVHLRLARAHAGRVRIELTPIDEDAPSSLDVGVVINAAGVEHDIARVGNPLLAQLLAQGIARRGPHGLGLDTTNDGELIDAGGHPQPRLRALGSLRIGNLWETTAIPEMRAQAEQIAKALLA